jgi:hypothetical protein
MKSYASWLMAAMLLTAPATQGAEPLKHPQGGEIRAPD